MKTAFSFFGLVILLGALYLPKPVMAEKREWIEVCCLKDPKTGLKAKVTIEKRDLPALKNCGYLPDRHSRAECARYYTNPAYIGENRVDHSSLEQHSI